MTAISQGNEKDDTSSSALPARPPLFVAQLPTHGNTRKITKVLIANRGEIACRIISTCRRLNLTSVALYTEEDSHSLHVSEADEAFKLDSIEKTGQNPFLNQQVIVDVALKVSADAVHPGYGYLSENGDFADAVRGAGLIFLGPTSNSMSILGDKRSSKAYLREHEPAVPLIPGFAGSSQNTADLEVAAEDIGFPVMLKASAGGGGRGMRIIREKSKLKEELRLAQSEAKNSFGSSDVILEKYIENGKHIEVQIVGDRHGKVVSLLERECSVQRRHQKVIEETPSPFVNPDKRTEMCRVAIKIGELLGYEGAGTVEFVVDARDGSFYFLEVNTRLQVEHPITEEVTGIDVVALQLYVAADGKLEDLDVVQNITQNGHAIECRLCAEEPVRDFLPEHGIVRLWKPSEFDKNSRDVRFETAMQSGAVVSIYFDSMIAKIVVWAPTRTLAIDRMVRVLSETVCAGVRTNQLFLQSCLMHPEFSNLNYNTSFIPRNLDTLLNNPHIPSNSQDIFQKLSLVSGLIIRSDELTSSRPSFRNVRKAFRNQHYDPINMAINIITTHGPSLPESPTLSIWETFTSAASTSESQWKYKVTFMPLSDVDEEEDSSSSSSSSAVRAATMKFNKISNKIRNRGTKNAAEQPGYEVELKDCQVYPPSSLENWTTARVQVSINKSDIVAYIATRPSTQAYTEVGESRSILCHFPALGTWVEYRCYDMLTYSESLRETAAAAVGPQSKSVKAPMPCKVLNLLKKTGDEVKAGETVMVIESMKMEMNITIGADGTFNTSVSEGEAVSEGKVLGWVD